MNHLTDKNILLGVTGGIAAYKSAELIRALTKLGANVQVITTPAAESFITPLTLQALSGNPVRNSLLDPSAEAGMGHIELARWADLIVVAPASADFLARLAHGFASDLLSTVCLAAACPIAVAPAMNQAMWHNHVTQSNMAKIAAFPHIIVCGPAAGEQACGDVGYGRMEEPSTITEFITQHFTSQPTSSSPQQLAGLHVVISAGPTREAIDPVRYLSNESSGKMGYALAQAALDAGARVTLISGPSALTPPAACTTTHVLSAQQMHSACLTAAATADIFIGAAAVADFRPAHQQEQKIKKGSSDTMHIELIKNPDIIADVAQLTPKPWVIGFAAETQDVEQYALGKLQAKNLDAIIANDVSDKSIGFNSDHNAVSIITHQGTHRIAQNHKHAIATSIIHHISQLTVSH
ncbi:bifunctional phosphopantothenoylcysteine decarboxylase/phosphopantothenate--cysteine ligase CoaBC [Marinagarivorans algicola]|uniref:bifunctional phosphopantothenoylcysteine decarboxylase/phosphopantothenate--cysteine ligase CoaBC n=1 Tax=Marinagarivorans algicola TaxID=1513270 RepID=UPI0006B573F9|nr:bifunctional phosphopantothenoylcysteine decarboxylase/phosphopantothenate--cysteine ligase CoaBC [Marinagarivorans algicola]